MTLSDDETKPEGAPEWMVSFADMITIIMAFFVVMFSIASGDASNAARTQRQIAMQSLQQRFGPDWKPFMSWSLSPGISNLPDGGKGLGAPAPNPDVGGSGETVRMPKTEAARIRVPGQGDMIAIGGMVRFQSASSDLTPGQDAALQHIADELAGKPQQVEVVAAVSQRRLPPGGQYRDRWELGYARCRRAAELFTALRIEPARLRLSVVPANGREGANSSNSEADDSVQVFLSATLPAGAQP